MLIADSAYPLTTYPPTWNGVPIEGWGFYLGGNTPHVWTSQEVAALALRYRYLLPIYTCSNPAGRDPAADARQFVDELRALGVPRGVLVQLDYETAIDSAYEIEFAAALRAAGYVVELYGSASTVAQNLRPDGGYDAAAWTGRDTPPADTAEQFVDVGAYDLNDFRPTAPLWDVTAQTIPAAPVAAIEEDDDMPQQIERTALHPDEYAYGVKAGWTEVSFNADGYTEAPAQLRVVVWHGNDCVVHDGIQVGGTAQKSYGVPIPAGSTGVTVRREDGSDFPVGVMFQ